MQLELRLISFLLLLGTVPVGRCVSRNFRNSLCPKLIAHGSEQRNLKSTRTGALGGSHREKHLSLWTALVAIQVGFGIRKQLNENEERKRHDNPKIT